MNHAVFLEGSNRCAYQAFIDDHRAIYAVEPICRVLPIALSMDRCHRFALGQPDQRSAHARRDDEPSVSSRRVETDNLQLCGVQNVWRQRRRDDVRVARCPVEPCMRRLGLQGALRGKPNRTTIRDKTPHWPLQSGRPAALRHAFESVAHPLAEEINRPDKAQVIHRRSWPDLETVEFASLTWVNCFNPYCLPALMAANHPQRPKQIIISHRVSFRQGHDSHRQASDEHRATQSIQCRIVIRRFLEKVRVGLSLHHAKLE